MSGDIPETSANHESTIQLWLMEYALEKDISIEQMAIYLTRFVAESLVKALMRKPRK